VNPLPDTANPEIFTFPGPISVKTTDCEAGDPTVTLPKLTVVELAEREGEEFAPDCARPHPAVPRIPRSAEADTAHARPWLKTRRARERDNRIVWGASIAILLDPDIFN